MSATYSLWNAQADPRCPWYAPHSPVCWQPTACEMPKFFQNAHRMPLVALYVGNLQPVKCPSFFKMPMMCPSWPCMLATYSLWNAQVFSKCSSYAPRSPACQQPTACEMPKFLQDAHNDVPLLALCVGNLQPVKCPSWSKMPMMCPS